VFLQDEATHSSRTGAINTMSAVAAMGSPEATFEVSFLKPGDHYILRKLSTEILPWTIMGRRLKKQWFVRLGTFYDYAGNAAAALAGLGIGAPLVSVVSSGRVAGGKTVFDALGEVLPAPWIFAGFVGLLFWLAIRLVVQHEKVERRALLARECAEAMKALYANLYAALPNPDPMAKIGEIQKSINEHVQNAIRSEVWPWEPLPDATRYSVELERTVTEIRLKFMAYWSAPTGVI
jgi:hypothetical protein